MTEPKPTYNAHGGTRDGAGRSANEQPRHNLVIAAHDSEYQQIIDNLTTRERTLVLMKAIDAQETELSDAGQERKQDTA